MKALLIFSAALLLGSFSANAGNFFGPAPFRNGSPLATGNDGSYQATARANNITGIFRFEYAGGIQTATTQHNNWIFFVNGLVVRGLVVANINESRIQGVLDKEGATTFQTTNSSTSAVTGNSTSVSLPSFQLYDTTESASGTFEGKLKLKSPSGSFSGEGLLIGSQALNLQLVGFAEEENDVGNGVFKTGNITVTNQSTTVSASNLTQIDFKFRGVRASTQPTATQN